MADTDLDDFDAFYAATVKRVVGYLYVVLGSVAEAEDSAHEAYARAWQRWSKVRGYDDPEAWVRTVAYRVALSTWRKTKNRLAAQRRGGTVAADVPALTPDRLAVMTALRQLPVEQRQALVLHHMQGMTVEEISRETGTPSGTVKARLVRGRRALAPYVSEFADEKENGPGGPTRSAPPRNAFPKTTPLSGKPPKNTSANSVAPTGKQGATFDA